MYSFFLTTEQYLKYFIFLGTNLSVLCYWYTLYRIDFRVYRLAKTCLKGSAIVIFFELLSRWIIFNYFPVSNLYETLLFLAWIIIVAQIFLETRISSRLWGNLASPLSAALCDFAIYGLPQGMQKVSALVPSLKSAWLMMHVSMMIFSYGILIFGSLLCILFLVLSYRYKLNYRLDPRKLLEKMEKRFKPLLPPTEALKNLVLGDISDQEILDIFLNYITYGPFKYMYLPNKEIQNKVKVLTNIDIWSYRIIGLGFPLLTIGIISGAVWANDAWGSYWSWDPKETWALITWIVFATYLHARITKGWQGRKAAFLGSFGFFILWVCYLGVNFLGTGLHSYGWIK